MCFSMLLFHVDDVTHLCVCVGEVEISAHVGLCYVIAQPLCQVRHPHEVSDRAL